MLENLPTQPENTDILPGFTHFLQKHGIEAINLPDQTLYWQLSSGEIKRFEFHVDKDFVRVVDSSELPKAIIWDNGPVLVKCLWETGIVFSGLREAKFWYPKILEHGFTEADWFPYFALNREDINQTLSNLSHEIVFFENLEPIIALEKPYGYVIRIGEGPGLWFSKEENVKEHQKLMEEVEKQL